HASIYGLAAPLTMGDHLLTGHGIIEKTTDKDVFKFQTGGGSIGINVYGAVHNLTTSIGNLDPAVELRSSTGALIASSNIQHSQYEFFTANLPAGTYYIVVASNGAYGDVGQYTVEAMESSGPGG